MPTTLHNHWHSTGEDRRATRRTAQRTAHDHKLHKAVIGIVLFVAIGFALAAFDPISRIDSPEIQAHTHFIKPAN